MDNNSEAKDESNSESLMRRLVFLATVGIVFYFLALFLYFYFFHGSISPDQTTWGQFGDFIGGFTNPVLSLLALFAILISLNLQMHELELTRTEVAKSTKALVDQSYAMDAQNFQSTFFRLLDFLPGLYESAGEVNNSKDPARGFEVYFSNILRGLRDPDFDIPGSDPETHARYIKVVVEFIKEMDPKLSRYLGALNRLADLIETSNGAKGQRAMYFEILASQLSRGELILIFFLAPNPGSGLRDLFPLIGKYGFFKNLGQDMLLYQRLYLMEEYPEESFAHGTKDLAREAINDR